MTQQQNENTMLSLSDHRNISRDIKKSTEENQAMFVQKLEKLQKEQRKADLKFALSIIAAAFITCITLNYIF